MIDCISLRKYFRYYKREREVRVHTIWRAINVVLPQVKSIVGPLSKKHNVPQYYYENGVEQAMRIYYSRQLYDTMHKK